MTTQRPSEAARPSTRLAGALDDERSTSLDPSARVAEAIRQAEAARRLAGGAGSVPPAGSAAPAPVGGAAPVSGAVAPVGSGFVVAGRSSGGLTTPAAGRHTTATPGKIELQSPGDQQSVQATLEALKGSATGAPVLAALVQQGVRIKVMSDQEFTAAGHDGAGAWFDTAADVMYLRRSWLEKNPAATASALAHEAVHAIDDASGLLQGAREATAKRLAQAPGEHTPQQVEAAVKQAMWELSIASEARAFLVQGQVLRELGQVEKAAAGGAIAVAAQGRNDQATYARVFQTLITEGGSAYNPEGRTATPFAI